MIAPHERDGDAGEAGAGGEVEQESLVDTEDFVDAEHSGETTRNAQADYGDALLRDASVARGVGAVAEGADFVAEGGAPDEQINAERAEQGEHKAEVERAAGAADAEEAEYFLHFPKPDALGKITRFRRHRAGLDEYVHQQVHHQGAGDEIEHYGGDDYVRAARGLQIARDESPSGAKGGAGDDGERDQQRRRQPAIEEQASDANAEAADVGLAFAADVE